MSERKEKAAPTKKSEGAEAAKKEGARKARAEVTESPKGPRGPQAPAPDARLQTYYRDTVVPELMKKFGYKTTMQVPRIEKITLNMGVGETTSDRKILDHAIGDMTKIAGQKPVATRSRKSIATFKVRQDYPIGCMVTLRGARMYDFVDKLFNVALPRVRDFTGVSPDSFDGRGNYTLGLREQLIFPEIQYDEIDRLRGMEVVIVTTANTDAEGRRLLELLGMPFRKDQAVARVSR